MGAAADGDAYWELPIPAQGDAPAEAVDLTKSLNPGACGLCHLRQYREWRSSLHARAVGPGLLGQLPYMDIDDAEYCLTCHAPRAEQQARILTEPDAPQPEPAIPELSLLPRAPPEPGGVDCAGCHVRAHRRHGPEHKPLTPHGPVTGLALFEASDFCAPCHQFPPGTGELLGTPLQDTHREWAASRHAAAGIGCQDCHMPGGSHTFRGIHDPETTRRALRIDLTRTAQGIRLRVSNTGAGHAVPTYATPRVRLQVRSVQDPMHQVEHIIQRTLALDPDQGLVQQSDTRLFPDQSVTLDLRLTPAETGTARILVEPDAYYHAVAYPALLAELPEDAHHQRRQLRQAQADSGTSAYVLFEGDCGVWSGQQARCRLREGGLGPTTDAASRVDR